MIRSLLLVLLLGLCSTALARDDDDDGPETVTGHLPPPVSKKVGDGVPGNGEAASEWVPVAPDGAEARPYPNVVYRGAEALSLQPEFVGRCKDSIEKIYRRDYKGAKAAFDQLGVDYKGWGVGPVGQALVWQAMMLENFDFRYETQYQTASKIARMELETSLTSPGNEAWEYFLQAAILGIDAMHSTRKGEYLTAINRGIEAMKALDKTKELAPKFSDATLGDGLYNYWRSVLTMSTPALPKFSDRRVEGLQQQMLVEKEGIFLSPAATLALTFAWIEEGDNKRALASALRNKRFYPDNVINNLVLGRIYIYLRKYDSAETTFKEVLATSADNQRAHFYLGRVYLRQKRYSDALSSANKYLAFPDLNADFRAEGLNLKGDIFYRQQKWDEAEALYKESFKVNKNERAKKRLEQVKKQR